MRSSKRAVASRRAGRGIPFPTHQIGGIHPLFGISKLCSAVASLTANVLAWSQTVADINTGLRGKLLLDAPEDVLQVIDQRPDPEALPVRRNGRKVAVE